jgi:ribosomal protein L37AE/L43A
MSETNPERRRKPEECPKCGSPKVLSISYGFPSAETLKAAQEGKIALGGCVIKDGAPTWRCDECGHEWGELRIDLAFLQKKPGDD